MYRLFCNKKMLFSRNFSEKFLDNYHYDDHCYQLLENTIDRIRYWLENETEDLNLDDVDNDILAVSINTIFKSAPAAGGVVLINDGIAAIERNGIPDLPKGHIENGESEDVAALREVYEETALSDLSIIKKLPSTFHCYLLNNQWTMKKTSWFLMKSDAVFDPKPQQEEGISKVFVLNKDNVNDFLEKTFVSLRITLEEEILKNINR
ncbi:MAG: NUDIX domain-containing protein [Lentimicrobiaceae bacterium]|nr:NUDIX domain-containing protein [Lentimicrobiaceae bacterium]